MEVFLSLEGEPHLELSPIETGQHLAGSGRGRVGRRWEAQRALAKWLQLIVHSGRRLRNHKLHSTKIYPNWL
jgi:hypothetical protein